MERLNGVPDLRPEQQEPNVNTGESTVLVRRNPYGSLEEVPLSERRAELEGLIDIVPSAGYTGSTVRGVELPVIPELPTNTVNIGSAPDQLPTRPEAGK